MVNNDFNQNDNASSNSSTALSTESSTTNYINHISANTTTTTSSGGADTTCSVSPTDSKSHDIIKPKNLTSQVAQDQHNAQLIEQLVQQQHKATLARQQMFENNNRFTTMNDNQYSGNANTLNATTAYLVQTPSGNALLIPPQTAMNPTNQFIQTNPTNNHMNTISLNRYNSSASNPYGITTVPYQKISNLLNDSSTAALLTNNGMLPQSPSVLSNNFNNNARPESTNSTNVYQTIDATEKNGYLYPVESSGYDSSTFYNNTNSTNNHKASFNTHQRNNKYKVNYQQHLQQQLLQQHQMHQNQHQNQFNNLGTLHSNTHNTNSNLFSSPTLSNESNRRHLGSGSSKLNRIKYQLNKKMQGYCSWKVLAFMFLVMCISLFALTLYLSMMRIYNLDWQLSKSQSSTLAHKSSNISPVNHRIGKKLADRVMPNDIYYIRMNLYNSIHVKFNLSMSRQSSVGVYMQKNELPSLTNFKYFETFNGNELLPQGKLAFSGDTVLVNTAFVHYLEQGVWFIAILNDNQHPLEFQFSTQYYESRDNSDCPGDCSGKGDCLSGICQCYSGFSGLDCSERSCPVLCSNNGYYDNGKCVCNPEYHGASCQLTKDQCEVSDCNGNGDCIAGKCQCITGFAGEFCQDIECDCSNNGICVDGACKCFANYTGLDCSEMVPQISYICSNRGDFNYETKTCVCHSGWLGADCSLGANCLDKLCTACKNGWKGVDCLVKAPLECDIRCNQHGICVNGTCNCSPGYQGRNCDINTCPKACSSNGICEKSTSQYTKYQCLCDQGWTGQACDVPIEMFCNDDIDNDNDGLIDCMDSECCGFDSCKLSMACQTAPEPKDRLLRKQPPSISATFFEKMRFLIEDNSVQMFANSNSFRESQVSVIRGQVLFKNGQPLIGVKVSAASNPQFGYTLTRANGIFDLMVNGGGSVLLELTRKDLKPRFISAQAVWNQFVHTDTIHMYLVEDKSIAPEPTSCFPYIHNTTEVQPVVKSCWKEIRTYYQDNSVLLPDSGVIRSEINLADTDLKLVYTSSQAAGFASTIFILLTKESIPESLKQVHVHIAVEGLVHKQRLDAYPSQSYEYAWDRRNAYEQRVYGSTFAKVMIGYEYDNCGFIYWETSVVRLAGYDLSSSEIGNWNIDVHHRLNVQQGILHKGDGSTIYLNEIQKQIEIAAAAIKFYSPVSSLTINKDGLIFIADSKHVWMLNNSGLPEKVLDLKRDQPYKVHLGNDQRTGDLFLVDSVSRQLTRVKKADQTQAFKAEVSSTFCFESNDNNQYSSDCSRPKNIQNPKSFAFDQNELMYFIDGNKIKSIDQMGTLKTHVGSEQDVYRPMECNASFPSAKMRFYWPTVLRVNPIDNSVYILDEQVIYKLDVSSNAVEVVLGAPYGCGHVNAKLYRPIDMAFNSEGDLYVLENDSRGEVNVKRVSVLKSSGERLETFYDGVNNKDQYFAQSFTFMDPVAIAVHQNNSVYVLDRAANVMYHIKHSIERDEYSSMYTLVSPETRETYVFNRFGLHLSTIDLLTGTPKFNFTYSGNALYGKLISVVDQHRMLVNIKRDFHGRVELLQTASDYNIRVKLNSFNNMKSLAMSDGRQYKFKYFSNTGLLKENINPTGKEMHYSYTDNGKVKKIVEPNNVVTNVNYFINESGIVTVMNRADLYRETWITNGSTTSVYKNDKLEGMMETNKYNTNIRAIASEADYNSFQLYYKSILNFQAQPSASALIQDRNSILNLDKSYEKFLISRELL